MRCVLIASRGEDCSRGRPADVHTEEANSACNIHWPTLELVDGEGPESYEDGLALNLMKRAKSPTSINEAPASIRQINLVNRLVIGDTDSFENTL